MHAIATGSTGFVAAFCVAVPAFAQLGGRDLICEQLLTSSGRPGLYYVHSGREAELVPRNGNGKSFSYNPSAKFYFVAEVANNPDEGVWHIRTQTKAKAQRGANQAFVYRPPFDTRCAREWNQPLQAFSQGYEQVTLNRYADHHGSSDGTWDRRPETGGLADRFHFRIKGNSPNKDARGCMATDDTALGNLWDIYGFVGVKRVKVIAARPWLIGTAQAQEIAAPGYDGLSSEFRYDDQPGRACFSFGAPFPTHSAAWGTTSQWGPIETSITIKQLKGRSVSVSGVWSGVVRWQQ